MGNAPAFQLYASDFYMDTVSWPIGAVGIYTRFLFYQWVNGFLPSNEKELARIAGCSVIKLKKNSNFWSLKFEKNGDGKLRNLRLEETRKDQEKYREMLANSGRLGGLRTQEKKRIKRSKASSKALSKLSSKNKALQSSSSISLKEKNKYLEFVFLTNEEYQKLIDRFGEKGTKDRIENLNVGIGSKGYKYESHYHTILNWERMRKDKEKPKERSYLDD